MDNEIKPSATSSEHKVVSKSFKRWFAICGALALVLLSVYWLVRRPNASPDAQALTPVTQNSKTPGSENNGLRDRLADLQQTNAVLREQILALTQRLSLVEDAISTMGTANAPASETIKFDQAEYSLFVAQTRLDLFADVKGATRACELADAILATSSDPKMAGVRQSLSIELDQLRATPLNDIAALSGRVKGLLADVDAVAVITNQDVPGRGRLAALLDRYLVVRREGDALPVVGRSAWAVREGLKIELERAMLALERNQPEIWQSALGSALKMADAALLRASDVSTDFKTRLSLLASVELHAKLPQLGASLRDMRRLRTGVVPTAPPVINMAPAAPAPAINPAAPTPNPAVPSTPAEAPESPATLTPPAGAQHL
jgi:uncharacterized protein HemX